MTRNAEGDHVQEPPHQPQSGSKVSNFRFGIGKRLLTAFVGVAGLTIIASAVSWVAFSNLETSLVRFTGNDLPAINTAFRLARESTAVAAAVPRLRAAADEKQRNRVLGQIESRNRTISDLIAKLEETGADTETVGSIRSAHGQITATIAAVKKAIDTRVGLETTRDKAINTIATRREAVTEVLSPMIKNLRGETIKGMKSTFRVEEDPIRARKKVLRSAYQSMSTLQSLLDLQFEADEVVALYREALRAESPAEVEKTREHLLQVTDTINRHLELLSDRSGFDKMSATFTGLLALGTGEAGVLAIRLQALDAIARAETLVVKNKKQTNLLNHQVETLISNAETGIGRSTDAVRSEITANKLILLGLGLVSIVIAVLVAWLYVARRIVARLTALSESVAGLAQGEQNIRLPSLEKKDEIGDIARSLMRIHSTGTRAVRVQTALDTVSSSVVVINNEHLIVYANESAKALHGRVARDLHGVMPDFPLGEFVGEDFDHMHNQPLFSRGALESLEGKEQATMEVSGHTFGLVVNPVMNAAGERLGTVLEVTDLTEQLAIEAEVGGAVEAAAKGDFSHRLDTTDKTGFMLQLSEGMNKLLETMERGLDEVAEVVSGLSVGDLNRRMVGDYQGTFLRLKTDSNTMAEKISSVMESIMVASDAVATAAAEISTGSADLASRTEEQASSIERTTASMEKLTVTTRTNADSAHQANKLAEEARDTADSGKDVVASTVGAMERIEESSRTVTEIVSMIDEIAFQTNLLALNAAVEAARAGDAGKGFAVVASEVRNLAQRTADSSKEIKALIETSVGQVQAGVTHVNETGKTLASIVNAVNRVADIVSEIATASGEQAAGLEKINAAVAAMDDMTQRNAALVEETAASSQSMATQAGDLQNLVQFFDRGNDT